MPLSDQGTRTLTAKSGRDCSVQILICNSMSKCSFTGDPVKRANKLVGNKETIVWRKNSTWTIVNRDIYYDC